MVKRIKIFGLHRKTGATRKYWFDTLLVGAYSRAARKVLELETDNYFVVVVDPYGDARELCNGGLSTQSDECASEVAVNIGEPLVKYPYKVHSINTVNQRNQGSHVGFVETLDEAMRRAGDCVKSWNPEHKGVVIFKAIKLVRMRPQMSPLEIIDL